MRDDYSTNGHWENVLFEVYVYSHIWTIRGAAQQGMVFASESGTGSTNQRFFLEQGILFAIPTLEHGRGAYFAARIAVQTNVVAVPARVPLHVHSNTPFQIRRSTSCHVFQSGAG